MLRVSLSRDECESVIDVIIGAPTHWLTDSVKGALYALAVGCGILRKDASDEEFETWLFVVLEGRDRTILRLQGEQLVDRPEVTCRAVSIGDRI